MIIKTIIILTDSERDRQTDQERERVNERYVHIKRYMNVKEYEKNDAKSYWGFKKNIYVTL